MNNIHALKNSLERQKQELFQARKQNILPRKAFQEAGKLPGKQSIKIILGPRRAGKSTFALSLVQFFCQPGEEFRYLNFDDQALMETRNHDDLFAAFHAVYGDTPGLILLDEIQNLDKWEVWLSSLHRLGYNIIATGSNANLLSRELATHLTGRATEIEIFPFSSFEYEQSGGNFDTFYTLGGYPDVLLNGQDKRMYLEGLKNSIILKDIITRFKIRNSSRIEACFDLLLLNPAALFTYSSIAKTVGIRSETTVRKYINYLHETYLFFELLPFSFAVKSFYRAPRKGYIIDNAFLDLIPNTTSENLSRRLENFVFLELIKSGKKPNRDFFFYRTKNNLEVDFLIKDGLRLTKLVQVCYRLDNLSTRERELKALVQAAKELGVQELEIVTWNTELVLEEPGARIMVTPIKKFLAGLRGS